MLGRRRGPLGGGGACAALVALAATLVACATTIPSVAGRPSGCCAYAATGSEIAIIVMNSRFMVPPLAPIAHYGRGAALPILRIETAEPLRQARAVWLAHLRHDTGNRVERHSRIRRIRRSGHRLDDVEIGGNCPGQQSRSAISAADRTGERGQV